MDRRLALGLAIGSAAAAVLLVAVDLQWNIVATFETEKDGQWVVIDRQDADSYFGRGESRFIGCASTHLRLTIENEMPWARDVDVLVTVFSPYGGGEQALVSETVHVPARGTEMLPFTVPDDAFNATTSPDRPIGESAVSLSVQVGNTWMGTCVEVPQ